MEHGWLVELGVSEQIDLRNTVVDVEYGWFLEQGANEQIDLWNIVAGVERMQANRVNVRKIAHLTTFIGGGYDFVWNKENALEIHENQPKLEKKQNFVKHRQW